MNTCLARFAFASLTLVTACASFASRSSPETPRRGERSRSTLAARFPAPARSLTIEGDAQPPLHLVDLVRRFEDASGERVLVTETVRRELDTRPIGLSTGVTIPPERVYEWFEAAIARQGYVLATLTDDEPRTLGLYAHTQRMPDDEPPVRHVEPDEIDELVHHPALCVQTVIDLAPLDARTLQNSLRALGSARASNLVAVGSTTSVVVLGTGEQVVGMVRLLRDTVKNELAKLEQAREAVAPEDAAQR